MLLQSSVDPLRWADAMIIISDDIRLAFSANTGCRYFTNNENDIAAIQPDPEPGHNPPWSLVPSH